MPGLVPGAFERLLSGAVVLDQMPDSFEQLSSEALEDVAVFLGPEDRLDLPVALFGLREIDLILGIHLVLSPSGVLPVGFEGPDELREPLRFESWRACVLSSDGVASETKKKAGIPFLIIRGSFRLVGGTQWGNPSGFKPDKAAPSVEFRRFA
jgi:hypothetical protein